MIRHPLCPARLGGAPGHKEHFAFTTIAESYLDRDSRREKYECFQIQTVSPPATNSLAASYKQSRRQLQKAAKKQKTHDANTRFSRG